MPVKCTCVGCGRAFVVSPPKAGRKWCSAACRYSTPGWQDVLRPGRRRTAVCAVCGAVFSVVTSRPGIYCSRACLGVANGRRRTDQRNPATWQTYTCAECGKPYRKLTVLAARTRFCSHSCRATWHDTRRRIARPTGIELALQAALLEAGIIPTREYRVGRFAIDLALPEQRLAIEADGAYWHSLPKQQAADARKDAYLRSVGWAVLRFGEAAILSDPAGCVAAVRVALAGSVLV